MYISKKELTNLKKLYPAGTKVKLVKMNDEYHSVPSGTIGIVSHVDDIGTVHISWATGSSLGAVYGEDVIEKV